LVLVALVLARAQTSVEFLPLLLASPPTTGSLPFSTFYFQAPLCSSPQYNNQVLTVNLNLPFQSWNQTAATCATVTVYNSTQMDKVIATNEDTNKNLAQYFSFAYLTSYGTLYIVVTTNNAASLTFTLDLQFKNLKLKEVPVPRSIQRLVSSQPPASTAQWIVLDQIYSDGSSFSVATGSSRLFNISYCPTGSPIYSLTFQLTALDDHSQVSLYVCTSPSQFPCTPGSALPSQSDARAMAVATVTLQTSNASVTNLQLNVWGWGQFNGTNNFLVTLNANAGK